MIEFRVPGEPTAKGRARSVIRAGHIAHHTPAKTVAYEGLVALAAQTAMSAARLDPLQGALAMTFVAVFAIPKGWTKKRLAAHVIKPEAVTKKPDLDNIMKALSDGMNKVVYVDDSQIAELRCRKVYGALPGVLVRVWKTEQEVA